MTERIAFFLRFIQEPKKIGSITPSSSYLVRRMLGGLAWDELTTIVELGAGTGVFTRFIATHKPMTCRVLVIEQDAAMRQALQRKHPSFLHGSHAEQMAPLLESYRLGPVDCIVSGLPFAAFSAELREAVLAAVWQSLKPGGVFIAFQYSLQLRPLLNRCFRGVEVSFVLLNLPPAFVYVCKK